MSRLPFVVRVAVGAVALAAEKGQEIASGAVTAPLTLGSMSAQAFIRMQQDLAELAVRGDSAIETIFPPKEEEQAEWATFDDDEDLDVDLPTPPAAPFGTVRPAAEPAAAQPAASVPTDTDEPAAEPEVPSGAGRYALYSSPVPTAEAAAPATVEQDDLPEAARRIDYTELTLAQLRGRLAGFTGDDVTALLAYERGHKARAPFLTMLENRLTR